MSVAFSGAPWRVVLAAEEALGEGAFVGRSITVLLNPTSLRTRMTAEWVHVAALGLSYEPLQYNRTRAQEIQAQFYLSAFEAARQGLSDVFALRDFLTRLLLPKRAGQSPPGVSIIWPNLGRFSAVLEDLTTDYTHFAPSGKPIIYTADCRFSEVRAAREALAPVSPVSAPYG